MVITTCAVLLAFFDSLDFMLLPTTYAQDQTTFYQISSWNNNVASQVGDNENSTCAVTGFETNPWLRIDLGEEKVVRAVHLQGGQMPGVIVRVGNNGDILGNRGGHENNPICRSLRYPITLNDTFLSCKAPLTGRFVSIEAFGKSENGYRQMTLCVVRVTSG